MLTGQLNEGDSQNQRLPLPANVFSSISSNTNRTPSAAPKSGRGRSNVSGTGSGRGKRGSQIQSARTVMVPVSGEGVARTTYTVAYCYQSVYYALKPNSNPPEVLF